MKKNLTTVLLILIGFVTVSSATAQSVTLRLQPEQGKTYSVTSKANMTNKMQVQGQSMTQSQGMELRQTLTPKNVTDKEVLIETQVDAIKLSMSVMGQKLEYDSEHPEKTSPMLAGQTKDLEASIKKPGTVKYDVLGNVIDSLDLGMSQLGAVILPLPEEELTVGSKWTSKNTQEVNDIEMVVNMEYTVTAISKKSVDVSFTGDVDAKDVTGTYTGTATIDPKTAILVKSATKSNVSMTITEQGMSIPITITGTTTIEVK